MNLSIKTLVAAAGIVCMGSAVHADTKPRDGVIRGQAVVRYGDLNLSDERDAHMMLRRIDRAAIDACGGRHPFGLYDGPSQQAFANCRADAVARAVAGLGAPLVTRVYAGVYSAARRS